MGSDTNRRLPTTLSSLRQARHLRTRPAKIRARRRLSTITAAEAAGTSFSYRFRLWLGSAFLDSNPPEGTGKSKEDKSAKKQRIEVWARHHGRNGGRDPGDLISRGAFTTGPGSSSSAARPGQVFDGDPVEDGDR